MRRLPVGRDLIRRSGGKGAVLDDLRNLLRNLVLHHAYALLRLADRAPALDGGELALGPEAREPVVFSLPALAGPPSVAHRLARHGGGRRGSGSPRLRHRRVKVPCVSFPPFRRFRGSKCPTGFSVNLESFLPISPAWTRQPVATDQTFWIFRFKKLSWCPRRAHSGKERPKRGR